MPIDFPNNPTSGQTYSYGINRWIYNGVAWDKLDNHPGISAGNQISVGYQESLSGASFSINVIEGHGSDLDADLLDGVSGERFIENLQTGVLYGGLISINAGNTATFDVSAGAGIIVNIGGSTTGYPTPTLTNVSWTAKTGVTTGYLGSTEETFISINSSGNLVLQSTVWSETQYESQIPIGTLFHHGTGYIDLAISIPHISYGQAQQFDPFIRAFGPLKLNGYELTGSTADFKIYKSSGKAYLMGRNYAVDPNNPNVVTDIASNPVQYYYMFYRDGSGGFDTTILTTGTDVTNYDDGTGILNSAPSGKYTTQRIFGLPNQPNVLGIYYGREIYNSLEDAKANIQYETFSESEATSTQGVFLGYLVCKANATNLGTTGDHEFIASGLFRNTSNIGGGGLAFSALTDLSDVNISSPSNNQALIYDSSTSAWVNKSFGNLPVVTSFNGLTGAVTGVNSIRGLTGTVGISAGLGITLSTSGQTLTISNLVTNEDTSISDHYLAFYGATSGIANPKVDSGLIYIPYSNSMIGYGGLILKGLSAGGAVNQNTLVLNDPNTDGIVFYTADNNILVSNFSGGFGDTTSLSLVSWDFLDNPRTATIAPIAAYTGNQTFTLPDDSGTIALTKNVVSSFNGLTGAVTGVRSIRGLTGAVGITNGSGIGLSVSGQTMTFSNTGVLSIDGGTGAITNVARTNVTNTFNTNQIISTNFVPALYVEENGSANALSVDPSSFSIIAYNDATELQQVLQFSASASNSNITLPEVSTQIAGLAVNQTFTSTNTFNNLTNFPGGISAAGATFSSLVRFNAGISAAGGTFSGTQTFVNGATFQGNINAPNIVTSFNGSTGAIVGVNSVRGLTGAVGITNGSGIGLSVSGQTMTFSNTGVLSIDGGTGAITNVARTNVSNIFTANQLISAPFTKLSIANTVLGVTSEYSASNITHYSGTNIQTISFNPTNPTNTITLPNVSTTLAGLAVGQTFTQVNTFNALTNFPGGISAAGATFTGDINLISDIYHKTDSNSSFLIQQHYSPAPGAYSPTTFINLGALGMALGYTGNGNAVKIIGGVEVDASSTSVFSSHTPLKIKGTTLNGSPTQSMTDWINPSNTVLSSILPSGGYSGPASSFSGLVSANAGISAAGATFSSLVRFNAGISSAGGTFSSQARFLSGITVAGGATFATDISVNQMTVGLGAGNQAFNVALGAAALVTNTTGNYNLGIGFGSLESNLDGTDNIALGYSSLNSNISGINNAGIGSSSLFNNTTGSYNTAIGTLSLSTISTGNDNVGIGYNSLGAIGAGRSQNTAIGSQAGYYRGSATSTLAGATGGIYIGYQSRASANAQTNEIVIGTQAVGLGSNTAVIGATTQTAATIYGLLNTPGGISAAGATFSSLAIFNAGISAAGGITFNSDVTVNPSNILNAGSIQTIKAALEIDTGRTASRVAIGDFNGLGNGNYIYIRNATNELDLVNPIGEIKIGDINALDTGNYIYYYTAENRLSSATNSDITEFGRIYANIAFYETTNQIRVTNNARSWFL